jgi:hypothetical protein
MWRRGRTNGDGIGAGQSGIEMPIDNDLIPKMKCGVAEDLAKVNHYLTDSAIYPYQSMSEGSAPFR